MDSFSPDVELEVKVKEERGERGEREGGGREKIRERERGEQRERGERGEREGGEKVRERGRGKGRDSNSPSSINPAICSSFSLSREVSSSLALFFL